MRGWGVGLDVFDAPGVICYGEVRGLEGQAQARVGGWYGEGEVACCLAFCGPEGKGYVLAGAVADLLGEEGWVWIFLLDISFTFNVKKEIRGFNKGSSIQFCDD